MLRETLANWSEAAEVAGLLARTIGYLRDPDLTSAQVDLMRQAQAHVKEAEAIVRLVGAALTHKTANSKEPAPPGRIGGRPGTSKIL